MLLYRIGLYEEYPLPQIAGMLILEVESDEEEAKLRLVEGNLWSEENLLKLKEYGDEDCCCG